MGSGFRRISLLAVQPPSPSWRGGWGRLQDVSVTASGRRRGLGPNTSSVAPGQSEFKERGRSRIIRPILRRRLTSQNLSIKIIGRGVPTIKPHGRKSSKEGAGKHHQASGFPVRLAPAPARPRSGSRKEHGPLQRAGHLSAESAAGKMGWEISANRKGPGKLPKEWVACLERTSGFCWVLGRGGTRRSTGTSCWRPDGLHGALWTLQRRHRMAGRPATRPLGRRLRRENGTGKLDGRQMARLNRLGIVWEPRPNLSWSEMYAALVEYQRVHGDCNVPYDWPGKPVPWAVDSQAATCSKGDRLEQGCIEQLDKLGFVWNFARAPMGVPITPPWSNSGKNTVTAGFPRCRRPMPRWATGPYTAGEKKAGQTECGTDPAARLVGVHLGDADAKHRGRTRSPFDPREAEVGGKSPAALPTSRSPRA